MQLSLTLLLAVLAPVQTAPTISFQKQSGLRLDAQKLSAQFATLEASDSCQGDATACISGGFAQCVQGQWQVTPCADGTSCYALPLVNKAGTALSCDTESDALARFAAAGVIGGITGNDSTNSDSGSDGEDTECDDDGDDSDSSDDGGQCDTHDGDDTSTTESTPASSVSATTTASVTTSASAADSTSASVILLNRRQL